MISRFFSVNSVRLIAYVMMTGFAVLLVLSSAGAFGQTQTGRTYTREDFINVEGGNLTEKLNRAEQQFKSAKQGDSYWVAYHFQAREGINVGPFSGYVYEDSDGIRLFHKENPDGVAVFFLMDGSGSKIELTRVKTLNLNEGYLFENRPVYWLGSVDTAQSLSQLQSIMRSNSDNKDIVGAALRAISIHNSPQVIPLLKEVALKDASYDIQRSAIRGLGRIPAKESLDALDEVFSAVGNTGLKQETIRSYGNNGDHIGEKRVLDKLTSIAKSDSENLEVRTEAIKRIASFRGDAVVDRLFDIYNSLGDRNVKSGILQQVSSRGTREEHVLQQLTAIAKKEQDAGLQSEAVRRISNGMTTENPEGAINALIDLYDSTPNDSVKEEVIKGLGRSKNRKAINKLLTIAEKDANPKLRQSAVRRLSANGNSSF